jgi:hypothetical protein
MLLFTPEESAANRRAYMHSLAIALIGGSFAHWDSATDEERDEVITTLTCAGIAIPANEPSKSRWYRKQEERVEIRKIKASVKEVARLRAKVSNLK